MDFHLFVKFRNFIFKELFANVQDTLYMYKYMYIPYN